MGKEAVILKEGQGETLAVMGAEVRFLCGPDRTDKAWSLIEVVLPENVGPPLHQHPWDEAYYVTDGQVRFTVGEKVTEVGAGDFIYAPGGTPHAFAGVSKEPARVLVFDAPAAAERFFRDVAREVKELPKDLAKVPEIGGRHRISFMRQ
jgi:quercetin dioxygenase-like cupin family protein